jgi:4-phosphopantoate--beta-alanine ligase
MIKLGVELKKERKEELVTLITTYDNKRALSEAISEIQEHLKTMTVELEAEYGPEKK